MGKVTKRVLLLLLLKPLQHEKPQTLLDSCLVVTDGLRYERNLDSLLSADDLAATTCEHPARLKCGGAAAIS